MCSQSCSVAIRGRHPVGARAVSLAWIVPHPLAEAVTEDPVHYALDACTGAAVLRRLKWTA